MNLEHGADNDTFNYLTSCFVTEAAAGAAQTPLESLTMDPELLEGEGAGRFRTHPADGAAPALPSRPLPAPGAAQSSPDGPA